MLMDKNGHFEVFLSHTSIFNLGATLVSRLKRHGIAECFVGIYSCDELGCGKERPDIYELSLKLLNVKKEDAVVFEDSKTAADTAKKAGFNVCLVKQDTFIKRTI